jgi:cardiolipin synthase A/B
MELLVQPEDGMDGVLKGIRKALRTIDMHIFRLDRKPIEKALADAVLRGVVVRTLIAHTNRGGENALRKLEQRLLAIGATVSRTADDLVRYHGKIMIVDRQTLCVLGYNLNRGDIGHCRSFGVVTRKRELVEEALKVFEADFDRKEYTGKPRDLVVSPVNARERLTQFIRGARKQLLMYGTLTDKAAIRVLQDRARAGVEVRIIGKLEKGHDGLSAEKYCGGRLHVRAFVRDGRAAFVGSQGLRKLELDSRREIGVIVKDPRVVKRIAEVFAADWARTDAGKKEAAKAGRKEKDESEGDGKREDKVA